MNGFEATILVTLLLLLRLAVPLALTCGFCVAMNRYQERHSVAPHT